MRGAVRAVRGGDREAFGLLLERYQRRLFGLTLMMVRDPEGAEEVTQDAFVRAFTRLHLYDEHRPFYPWLATIAVRLAQNWLSRHNREWKAHRSTPTVSLPRPLIPSISSSPTSATAVCGDRWRRSRLVSARQSRSTIARE